MDLSKSRINHAFPFLKCLIALILSKDWPFGRNIKLDTTSLSLGGVVRATNTQAYIGIERKLNDRTNLERRWFIRGQWWLKFDALDRYWCSSCHTNSLPCLLYSMQMPYSRRLDQRVRGVTQRGLPTKYIDTIR